jgi:rubrerythrin
MNQDEFNKIISHAISQEVEAFTFYKAVSDRAKDVNLKKLFEDLAGEEEKHKRTLEGYLTKGSEKIHFSESADYRVVDALPTPL